MKKKLVFASILVFGLSSVYTSNSKITIADEIKQFKQLLGTVNSKIKGVAAKGKAKWSNTLNLVTNSADVIKDSYNEVKGTSNEIDKLKKDIQSVVKLGKQIATAEKSKKMDVVIDLVSKIGDTAGGSITLLLQYIGVIEDLSNRLVKVVNPAWDTKIMGILKLKIL